MTRPSIPAFLPFYERVIPRSAVETALRDLIAPVAAPDHAEDLVDEVWEELATTVEGHSFRMLIGEFHAFRKSHGLPMTAESDEALRRFRRHLGQADGADRVIHAYPVLKQRLETILHNSLDGYAELFTAYAEDRTVLAAAGLVGSSEDERIVKIFVTGSDPHNDNRQVIGVRVTSGRRLVFKPRPLVSDRFVRDLYEAADQHLTYSLRSCVPDSVTVGSHGWQSFVESGPMDSPGQPARYFYRFGALSAILGSIGASDLHDENLLACGENPCVIDTETMIRPDAGVGNDTLPHALMNQAKLSIVSTMLVPVVNPASPNDLMMAGVGVAGDQTSTLKRAAVRDGDTDNISVAWEPVTYKQGGNVPRLGDAELSSTNYFGEILSGYFDALACVRGDGILKVIDAYPGMPVRCLLRSTMVYTRYLDAATHPDYLSRREEADRLLRLMARFPDFLSQEAADYVGAEERAALDTGDVPYFVSRSDATELATLKTRFPGVYRTTALDFARRGVALNSERTDLYHHFLLEECFSELAGEDDPAGLSSHGVFRGTLDRGRPGAWWPEIARIIAAVGVSFEAPDGRETGWVCGIGPGREAATIAPGNFIAFHDSGGIIRFLERASRHDRGLSAVHRSADRGWDSLWSEYGEGLMRAPESVFSGAASMLLTKGAGVDRGWLERVFDGVDERAAAGDLEDDLVNGPAGLLMAVLSWAEQDESVLCGEERLGRLRDLVMTHVGVARKVPWFDVAHGELGMRWACARMGRVLADPALVDETADWLMARSVTEDETPLSGWCNGAAGLLLTSAEIMSAAGRQEWLAGGRLRTLADRATRLPEDRPVDLSVCHGSSGVVQSLIATGRLLGDESLLTRAHEYQEAVLDRARVKGFCTGVPGRTSLLGYMLGWAGVGDTDVLLHETGTVAASGTGHSPVPVALSSGFPVRQQRKGAS